MAVKAESMENQVRAPLRDQQRNRVWCFEQSERDLLHKQLLLHMYICAHEGQGAITHGIM